MVAPHRLVGEAAAIVAGILDAPVLLEVGVELLEAWTEYVTAAY